MSWAASHPKSHEGDELIEWDQVEEVFILRRVSDAPGHPRQAELMHRQEGSIHEEKR